MYLYDLTDAEYDTMYDVAHSCLQTRNDTSVTYVMLTYANVSLVDFQTYFKQGSLAAMSEVANIDVLAISKIALPMQTEKIGTLATYAISTNDTEALRKMLRVALENNAGILYAMLKKYGVPMQPGLWVDNTQWLQYPGEPVVSTPSIVMLQPGQPSYSQLGIILGTVLGFLTLLKLIFAIWYCTVRRRTKTPDIPVSEHTSGPSLPYHPRNAPWYRPSTSHPSTVAESEAPSMVDSINEQRVTSRAQFWKQFAT